MTTLSKLEKIKRLYSELGIENLTIYHDPNRKLMDYFNVNSPPTTVFINKQGEAFAKIGEVYNWQDPSILEYILEIKDR
ncbi:TlpA family protein disulfide reductase [Candidatus Bandiella euplotis]|uniref:TlpA family protein disulfide reductase C-terminal domain protein n=1 Tax=Candidatus Bandiella euplotis TaxID=1664265 RepID=A0ABZ0UNS3_9RICK|nr:hypothetical protein [Candidatus Bandiella woodruffii]WPX96495.1 TlpA family protein disulfide reductase C-terminal domain protein [Candidatus Bandiella woodruffii]